METKKYSCGKKEHIQSESGWCKICYNKHGKCIPTREENND